MSGSRIDKLRGARAGLLEDERGLAMVEFSIVVLLLATCLFGFAALGQMLWYHHIVTIGVRDATRFLTRVPLTGYDTQAKNLALTGRTTGGTPAPFWNDPGTIAITHPAGAATVVRVTATVPVTIVGGTFAGLVGAATFTITDEARWIGE